MENIASDAAESQPLLVRYEDHFQTLSSRCDRMTMILDGLVNALNGVEPPELNPHGAENKEMAVPTSDQMPMLPRLDRVSANAFTSLGQLEHQLERLQALQLI